MKIYVSSQSKKALDHCELRGEQVVIRRGGTFFSLRKVIEITTSKRLARGVGKGAKTMDSAHE